MTLHNDTIDSSCELTHIADCLESQKQSLELQKQSLLNLQRYVEFLLDKKEDKLGPAELQKKQLSIIDDIVWQKIKLHLQPGVPIDSTFF